MYYSVEGDKWDGRRSMFHVVVFEVADKEFQDLVNNPEIYYCRMVRVIKDPEIVKEHCKLDF